VEAFLREKEDVQSYSSGWDDRDDFKRMIYHTTNLAAVLETEKEKADRLLSAWEISLDSSRDVKTRATNREFVMWCGCDPDDEVEHQWLIEQRECIDLEEKMAIEMSAQLVAEYDQRRSYSEMNELERDSLWLQRREDQLKHQIKYLKKRSKKLWAISCNCERAAMRRTPWSTNDFYQNSIPKGWENYYRCRGQWTECNIRLYELEKRLMDVRRTRKRVSKFTELE